MTTATAPASYLDFSSFDRMRLKSKTDSNGALRDVANQFESIFLKMALKSMREASLGDERLDSETTNTYRDMYDSQLAVSLAGKGTLGLANVLFRQLGGVSDAAKPGSNSVADTLAIDYRAQLALAKVKMQNAPKPVQAPAAIAPLTVSPLGPDFQVSVEEKVDASSPQAFARSLRAVAERTGKKLGVDPTVLIAQAALETGWGKHVVSDGEGRSSISFFNIKASGTWAGSEVSATTVEYKNGVPKTGVASFRSYKNAEESFADYAQLLEKTPRYENALKKGAVPQAYAAELQKAGFATDPHYAEKVARIAEQIQKNANSVVASRE